MFQYICYIVYTLVYLVKYIASNGLFQMKTKTGLNVLKPGAFIYMLWEGSGGGVL